MKSFLLKCLLFLICFGAVERFCNEKTHGFRLHKIFTTVPPEHVWETASPSPDELEKYFSQKYHFLDRGGECYVFASEDGRYVLKFFKQHHLRPPYWASLFPKQLKEKILSRYSHKREKFYTSCKLVYDHFRERSGLLYLHLNPTTTLNKKLKIYDPIGAVHTLDLDQVPFALQEKATLAYMTLNQLVLAQEMDAAKLRLNSLIDLILERCQAGIADHDLRKKNFGFVGNKAIELDLGSFTFNEDLKKEEGARRVLLLESMKIRQWLKKNTPALCDPLEENIQNRLES